jgi:enamine deaminase RidA (YjgF/YER057c/UK114 family)
MDRIEYALSRMGLVLPGAPKPGASYLPYRINGDTLILAGVISIQEGIVSHTGQAGPGKPIEESQEAARVCALNALASIKAALGSLDRVREFLFVSGYVNAVAGFDQSPQVINGASDLFVALYGERGRHARAAVAVAGLPRNATVEIQVTVLFD